MRLVGIYNADSGLSGELRYGLDKVLGRGGCTLCELTHGWNPFGKRSWRHARRSGPIPIEMIHRDEASASQLAAAGSLPAVLIGEADAWRPVADAELIGSMRKNPAGFLDHLARLAESSAG